VLPDQVAVLSDVAERPEEIDLERARKSRERAETRIATGGDDIDFRRAELKLQRAMIRIQLASRGCSWVYHLLFNLTAFEHSLAPYAPARLGQCAALVW
jgi:hypothetical protein